MSSFVLNRAGEGFFLHSSFSLGSNFYHHGNRIYRLKVIKLTVAIVLAKNSSLVCNMWVVKEVRGDLTFSALWKSFFLIVLIQYNFSSLKNR